MIAPPLPAGGTIGLCTPSHIAKEESYQKIIYQLRRRGFQVKEADNLYKATDGYLATPEERAHDLNQLIHDPQVDLILFGGGEAGNELLPLIDYDYLRAHPKRLCSYSDGTFVLDAVWARTGLTTYYGFAPTRFGDLRAYDYEQFVQHLLGNADAHVANTPWQPLSAGEGQGILLGGYLRNIALMLGGQYLPYDPRQKYVLFLEDHEKFGNCAYISAMLTHIEQSGFMDCVSGVLFGHYSETVYPELLARLTRLGERYGIPVVYCDDFGHGRSHAVLDIGRRAVLSADHCTLLYCNE